MTMPESVVAPPVETPALFGLYSAARMLPLSGHDEWGITYDVLCGDAPGIWPGACRPVVPAPEPVTRTITLTLTGARTGVDPTFTYTVDAAATVDSGPPRALTISVAGRPAVQITTGEAAVQVYSDPNAAAELGVDVTDLHTGTVTQFAVAQDATTGAITPAVTTIQVEDEVEQEKVGGGAPTTVIATPFVVYAAETCLLGFSPQEIGERARQRLTLIEQTAVERAFWTGEYGTTPALATSNPTVLGAGAPVDLVFGLSLLEQWLGATGVAGFIHASRGAAAIASELGLVRRVGSRLETEIGNVWVFGGGYPATGPTGQPAPPDGQVWMFATRQPTVRRTEVITSGDVADGSGLNYRKNNALVVAERVVVADFPCASAAVLVDLSICRCRGE